jgi:hypothetical protein
MVESIRDFGLDVQVMRVGFKQDGQKIVRMKKKGRRVLVKRKAFVFLSPTPVTLFYPGNLCPRLLIAFFNLN